MVLWLYIVYCTFINIITYFLVYAEIQWFVKINNVQIAIFVVIIMVVIKLCEQLLKKEKDSQIM